MLKRALLAGDVAVSETDGVALLAAGDASEAEVDVGVGAVGWEVHASSLRTACLNFILSLGDFGNNLAA